MEKLLTVQAVSEILGISQTTVYAEIKAKTLPAFKIGGSYRVEPASLERYLAARRTNRRTT